MGLAAGTWTAGTRLGPKGERGALLRTHLPLLSQPQATVLALWSLGMVLAHLCALTAVAVFLAGWLHRKEQTVRQQLREFC